MTVPEDLASLVDVDALELSLGAQFLAIATRRPDLETDSYLREVVLFERFDHGWEPAGVPRLSGALPKFSPDGEHLALLERGPGGETRVVMHDLIRRTRRDLLLWPDAVEELTFSPSGDLLGIVARHPIVPPGVTLPHRAQPPRVIRSLQFRTDTLGWTVDRPRHCFALELYPKDKGNTEEYAPLRKLSGTGFDDWQLTWLGTDAVVAFVSRRHDGREWDVMSDVYVSNLAEIGVVGDVAPRKLTTTDRLWGPLAYEPGSGRLLARYQLVAQFPCDEKLAWIDPAKGSVAEVDLGIDRSLVGPLSVVPGAASALSLLVDSGSVQLVELAADDADPKVTTVRRLTGRGVVTAFAAEGDVVAVAGRLDGKPAVVQIRGGVPDSAKSEREVEPVSQGRMTVYEPNAKVAEATCLLEAKYVGATAEDGTSLDCWVLLPAEETGILGSALYVPGGGGQWGHDYVHDFQVLASAGIAVFFGNARGSGGYGEQWMRTVCGSANPRSPGSGWGGVDRSDMLTMTDSVLDAYPQLPRDKVAVLGGSYGGLMAALLAFTSDRFCAVVTERGPFNLAQMQATSDEGPWFFDAYIGVNAEEDPERYAASSVISHVDGVKQPVLIVHSEHDLRCPVQQAEELFTALRRRNADVTFVRFPGESHELSRSGGPVHRVQRIQLIRDWLLARLLGERAAFEREA